MGQDFLIFSFFGISFIETGSCYVSQAGLEFLGSSNPTALTSQRPGIADVSHCGWPVKTFFNDERNNYMFTSW